MDVHYNQNLSRAESYAAGITYNPEPGKVLSARYKYGRNERIYLQANGDYFYDRLSQVDLAAQWPLSKNLYAVARYNYEIEAKNRWKCSLVQNTKATVAAGAQAWSANAMLPAKTATKRRILQPPTQRLEQYRHNPFEKLRLAIPGYSKTNEVVKQ